jgi:WhiB family transcriptional regulator, redox-sensing transcriptional regulator
MNAPQPEITEDWMLYRACRDHAPGSFFPTNGAGVIHAKRTCSSCPVRAECLRYALELRIDHGVWGGCSERERRRILQRLRLAASV